MPTTRSSHFTDVRQAVASSNGPPCQAVAAEDTQTTSSKAARPKRSPPDEPPKFTIELSLPPEQRYLEVCTALKAEIESLTSLFDDVVGGMVHFMSTTWLHFWCRMLLRRVYNSEENRELQGISKATGVGMYLLVCFNVLLDLFMGCSSGAAAVKDVEEKGTSKMLHFRTLDWGVPALRRIIVHLDFVTEPGGAVVASSITYAGFVGVLTGVRKDLSVSLNFRPNRIDNGQYWSDVKYSWHLLMVLLGRRPSIASLLRTCLLPTKKSLVKSSRRAAWSSWEYAEVLKLFSGPKSLETTACYLCFSNGQETTVVEKDRITATSRASGDFIVVTNNDLDDEGVFIANERESNAKHLDSTFAATLAEIVDEAKDRKECAEHNYHNLLVSRMAVQGLRREDGDRKSSLEANDIIMMVQKYPTTNEETHFACVMDPKEGEVVWCRRWIDRISAKWIREHKSDTW